MMKKLLIILSIFFLLIPNASALAKDEEKGEFSHLKKVCGTEMLDEEKAEKISSIQDSVNLVEKFFVRMITSILSLFGINTLSTLIYGDPYCVWAGKGTEMSGDGVFTQAERDNIIQPVLNIFTGTYVLFVTLAILISSMKMGIRAYNPQARTEFWQDINMWFVSALFMLCSNTIINMLFSINKGIVTSISKALNDGGIKTESLSLIASIDISAYTGIGLLAIMLQFLIEWILGLYLNIIYIARKIIIMLLLMLSVVAAISLLFNKTRGFFGVWMKELVGNIFINSIHALVMFGFAQMAAAGAGSLFKIGLIIMFIPITGMFARLLNFGDNSSKLGTAMTIAGLGGVSGAMNVIKQSSSVMSNMRPNSSLSNTATSLGDLVQAGGGSDFNPTSISSSASGDTSSTWQSLKQNAGKVGAVAGGVAGAVLGPQGSQLGAKVGQSIAAGTLQAGRNLGMGSKGVLDTVGSAMASDQGMKGIMSNLATRRQFFGDMGESLGTMVATPAKLLGINDMGKAGRNIGMAMSGVSRQRLANAPLSQGGFGIRDAAGNIKQMDLQSLAKVNPGGNMRYVQTNKGSGFYMQSASGGWRQVAMTGQADPSLKNGEARRIDYQLSNGSPATLQQNGSYKYSASPFSPKGAAGSGATAGLSGSTPSLMRQSDAYIVGNATPARTTRNSNGNNSFTQMNQAAAASGPSYRDTSFNLNTVNPDSYFAHNLSGSRTTSDRTADGVHQTGQSIHNLHQNYSAGAKVMVAGWKESYNNVKQKFNGRNVI